MKVSKSIWDVRFAPRKMALDAEVANAFGALDEYWITMRGSHVLVDDEGNVAAGAGGKFNGQSMEQLIEESATRNTKLLEQYRHEHKVSRFYDSPENQMLRRLGKESSEKRQRALTKLNRESRNAVAKDIAKPDFVDRKDTEGLKDVSGNPMPVAEIPETLEGAKNYFHNMLQEYKSRSNKNKFGNYEDRAMARRDKIQTDYYYGLEGYANKWEHLTPEKARITAQRDGAGSIVRDCIYYAKRDTSGVGRWLAKDMCNKYDKYLTPQERADFNNQIDNMEYKR